MFSHARRTWVAFPLLLTLVACADEQQSRQIVPADSTAQENGQATPFTQAFQALQTGDYSAARPNLEQSAAQNPGNGYDELALGAVYQNTGNVRSALPLYRDVIAKDRNVYPVVVTQPDDNGKSLAAIAEHNLQKAGVDQYGNVTGAQYASLVEPVAGPVPNYQVFFGFNQTNISPEASAVIERAARAARSGSAVRVSLIGHTDSVGTDSYNQRLSDRRAAAVEEVLEREGIASNMITARGVGKGGQLVQTPDQVREPQNRRVEIDEEQVLTQ